MLDEQLEQLHPVEGHPQEGKFGRQRDILWAMDVFDLLLDGAK